MCNQVSLAPAAGLACTHAIDALSQLAANDMFQTVVQRMSRKGVAMQDAVTADGFQMHQSIQPCDSHLLG